MAEKKNISSGAKKAENLAKNGGATKKTTAKKGEGVTEEVRVNGKKSAAKTAEKPVTKQPAKSEKNEKPARSTEKRAPKGKKREKVKGKKHNNEKRSQKRAERAKRREEKRAKHKQAVADRKQARLERRLAYKEKKAERIAALKERREERREERRKRRDMIKKESKQQRNKRIAEEKKAKREARQAKHEAYLAEKRAKREAALRKRAEKREERNEKRHAPGFGGWLAAVISLGVTTMALGTVLTFGWLTMDNMQADMAAGYTQSLYELNSVVDNLDANLARAKASSSSSDRVRVLTDIAVESQTAETILERFPLDMQMTEQFTSFINKMGDSAKSMLYTVANGGELTPSQIRSLNYMYETNAKLKDEINYLVSACDGKDLMNAMRGKSSALSDGFTDIQNNTFETPKGIQDGPFADSLKKTNPRALKGAKEITAQQAEELAKQYFNSYKVSDVKCTGEATGANLSLYNVVLTTNDGEMMAQISKLGGKVVEFDSFKDCTQNNFSVERCIDIAQDFLASLGYKGLSAVWASENGTTCNLNFAPVKGGVVLYPDLIKVKVCEERGIVTGMEARSYVLNHGERKLEAPAISKAQAQAGINGNIEVKDSRTALIPFDGGEVLCYEFFGELDGNDYFVYVDAATGEEIEVLTVIGTAQGRAIM